jgi:hypothetical protein
MLKVVDFIVDNAKIITPKEIGNAIKHTKKTLVRLKLALPTLDFSVTLDIPRIGLSLSLNRAREQDLLVKQSNLSNKEDSIYVRFIE